MAGMGPSHGRHYEHREAMTPSQIITADAERNGVDPRRVLSYVAKIVQSGQGTVTQAGNSILLITSIGDGAVELHLYTVDTPLALAKNLRHFIDVIKQSKARRVYGKSDNQGILEMLRRLGVNVEESDMGQYNWMANV